MTAEDGLNMIHFGFVHRVALKNKILFNHLKNGIFLHSLVEGKVLHLRLDY